MSGGNQALDINFGIGGISDLEITTHGSDWYWAVFAIMTASTLAFIGMSFTKPSSHRLFHYITALVTCVAAIAYFSMAAGLGKTPVRAEFFRPDSSLVGAAGTREMFYVRYIDWAITTPLLLLDLLLTAGLPWPTVLVTILADEVMVVTGLVAALTSSTYKWGYFTFGTAAFLFVVYQLAGVGLRSARALGAAPGKVYFNCGVLTLVIWFFYPIAFGLSEGGNVIHPDGESAFYGVLDVIAKPIFGFLLLFGHRNISPAELGLRLGDHETDGTTTTTTREKRGLFGRNKNHGNGATTTTTGANNV